MGYLIFETQKYEIPKKQSPIKKKKIRVTDWNNNYHRFHVCLKFKQLGMGKIDIGRNRICHAMQYDINGRTNAENILLRNMRIKKSREHCW